MEIRKAIKRIIALGTGATMLGATVLGAMAAADLGSYPAPFVVGSTYNAVAIVGANAKAADSIGVADVLLGLAYIEGAASTTATTSLEGDAYKIAKGTDVLNLYEYLSGNSGAVALQQGPISTVTKNELNALAYGSITNEKGTFTYSQFIDMPDNASIVYEVNSDVSDDPALYLKFVDGSQGYKYSLTFGSAVKSDIDDADDLDDLDNKRISMLGKEFTIISTDNSTGVIDLMAGSVQDTLSEGESKTYTINGIDYETEVIIITDTGTSQVKFKINGETTDAMVAADTFKLADGTEIGVKEILANEAGDVTQDLVEFYLGAEKITFTDAGFDGAGTLTVGGEDVSDVVAGLTAGTTSSTTTSISNIDVTWTTGDDYYVPIGGKLSDQLEADEKDKLFLENLDFEFTGVDFGETEEIKLKDGSSTTMKLSIPTKTGGDLNFYAFYTDLTDILLGKNADRPLVIAAGIPIKENYEFIATSNTYSHLLELTNLDETNHQATFKDVGLGTSFKVTMADGVAKTFRLDGQTYTFTANYGNDEINFTNSGANGVSGVIYTSSEAFATISLNGAQGLVVFTENADGPGDSSGAEKTVTMNVINSTISGTNKIEVSSTVASTDQYISDGLKSWDSKDEYQSGYTRWGTYVELDTNDQNSVTLTYPEAEAIADVYITSGVVSTSAAGGEVGGLVQVDVGSAMLDSEVADWEAQNVIVVGGPCVNTVAAELMGNPADCTTGFEEGKAKIKLFEGENVALLIAGYSADDTRRACTVMKNYKDYADDLGGMEVEMTATSDADIVLGVPTVE